MSTIKRDSWFVDPKDYKFTPVDADADFDPEHNKQVIEGVIKKTEQEWKRRRKIYGGMLQERSEALSSFLKAREQGGKGSSAESYFGKRELARLRGEQVLKQLKKQYASKKQEWEEENV